ncbi:MAG: T9SS type A sorting domain-containing protein [Flavobacteriales bacterium]
MNKFLLLPFAMIISSVVQAQTPTWSDPIAQIVYDNCTKCHRPGQLGPFSLTNYVEASSDADELAEAVLAGEMPPWPANPDYRHFAYEQVLSAEEIEAIVQWAEAGAPSGDLELAPDPPVFPVGSQLETIDLTLQIEPYTLQSNYDEYRWFAIENPFDETIYINTIEVIPGLPELVHHADISYDEGSQSINFDNADPLSGFNNDTGYPNYDYYMNAWMAGGNVVRYPDNWGIEVPPGSHFVFEIHYGPGGQGQTDSTKMNLQFVTDPDNVRPVQPLWLLSGPSSGNLFLPANEVTWFTQQSSTIWSEKSMIAICPHQHMLGDTYKVWMETAEGDSIPLVDIPQWDFHWQMYYYFIYPQYIPEGAVVKSIASFDNTVNNEDNPNNPPQNVWGGPTTTSEMLMVFAIWSNYQPGDEEILMDSTYVPEGITAMVNPLQISLYPNPAVSHVYISTVGKNMAGAAIECSNMMGQTVMTSTFDGGVMRLDLEALPAGPYVVTMKKNNDLWRGRVLKQ